MKKAVFDTNNLSLLENSAIESDSLVKYYQILFKTFVNLRVVQLGIAV